MARDYRPRSQKVKTGPQQGNVGSKTDRQVAPRPSSTAAPAAATISSSSRNREETSSNDIADDGEEGTEEELRRAIATLGGEDGDLALISGKSLKAKGKGKQADLDNEADDVSRAAVQPSVIRRY